MDFHYDSHVGTDKPTQSRQFGWFLILAGLVGWIASFELLTEYVKTLQTPGYIPNCSISKLVTCGPNMGSWQGSVFGFSNTIIGVAAFMAPVVVGVAILAGSHMKRWFWVIYLLGMFGAVLFTSWLQYQSIFNLGTMCPWCIVVWLATIPLFWVSLFQVSAHGHIGRRAKLWFTKNKSWAWVLITIHIIVLAGIAQIALNWFNEFNLH